MARQIINSDSQRPFGPSNGGIGSEFGDTWDIAIAKINAMFEEVYAAGLISAGAGLTLAGGVMSIAPGAITNGMLENSLIQIGGTSIALGGSTSTIAGPLSLSGTVNFTGTLEIGGTALTLPVGVSEGGTGAASFTGNGVLYGNGTSAIQSIGVNNTSTNKFLSQVNGFAASWNTIQLSDLPSIGFSNLSGNISVNQMAGGSGASSSTYWRGDGTWATAGGALANPAATIGLTAVNGSATTGLRSDGAPALSQAIAPTWTGFHTFANNVLIAGANELWLGNPGVVGGIGAIQYFDTTNNNLTIEAFHSGVTFLPLWLNPNAAGIFSSTICGAGVLAPGMSGVNGTSGSNPVTEAAAVNAVIAAYSEIWVFPGVYNIGSNITFAAGKTIHVVNGATFNLSSGITLTINSELQAGRYQIFTNAIYGASGNGAVDGLARVYPEWWGAKADGSTLSGNACQSALICLASATVAPYGCEFSFGGGTYVIDRQLGIALAQSQNLRIKGQGSLNPGGTTLLFTFASGVCLNLTLGANTTADYSVEGLCILASTANNVGVYIGSSAYLLASYNQSPIRDVSVNGFAYGFIVVNARWLRFEGCSVWVGANDGSTATSPLGWWLLGYSNFVGDTDFDHCQALAGQNLPAGNAVLISDAGQPGSHISGIRFNTFDFYGGSTPQLYMIVQGSGSAMNDIWVKEGVQFECPGIVFTATATSGSNVLTGCSSTVGLANGYYLTGNDIAQNATITGTTSSTVTMSANATGTGTLTVVAVANGSKAIQISAVGTAIQDVHISGTYMSGWGFPQGIYGSVSSGGVLQDLFIDGNYITDPSLEAIWLSGNGGTLEGVNIYGNNIKDPHSGVSNNIIYVEDCKVATVNGNMVSSNGAGAARNAFVFINGLSSGIFNATGNNMNGAATSSVAAGGGASITQAGNV